MLFEMYRVGRQWFLCVELLTGMASGIIGGLMPADSCEGLLIALCVVSGLYLVLLVLLAPLHSPLERGVTLANGAVTFVLSLLALFPDAGTEEPIAWLAVIQMWFAFVMVFIALLQLLWSRRVRRKLLRAWQVFRTMQWPLYTGNGEDWEAIDSADDEVELPVLLRVTGASDEQDTQVGSPTIEASPSRVLRMAPRDPSVLLHHLYLRGMAYRVEMFLNHTNGGGGATQVSPVAAAAVGESSRQIGFEESGMEQRDASLVAYRRRVESERVFALDRFQRAQLRALLDVVCYSVQQKQRKRESELMA
jgi:hypothetical protein